MADNASETTRSTNRLSRETSPYLLQHKENPVDWYPWGDEAFEKARSEDKPIFLSIGYSSCHWCHVMEEESFENEEVAEMLNDSFVSIKVDREERPDVDGLYMDFVQRATGQGGWPLSVFLFPDGRPFYGGTYFPPEDRFGRPGFKRILQTMADYWEDDRERLEESAEEVAEGLGADVMGRLRPEELSDELLEQAVSALAQQYDASRGGFGEAPKFPQAATLSFLLRESIRSDNPNARRMALHTLDQMHDGGMYDHLGGGFHRYSTDADWLVPHFEKMLYDNALLVRAYLEAHQLTGDTSYREVAEEILEYVRREMMSESGGFYTAQDADTEGEEGKFYVWQYDDVADILSQDELEAAAAYFDISSDGNWEGKTILRTPQSVEQVADQIERSPDETKQFIESSRQKLFDARGDRQRPGLDDKVLAAWNGMMCTAVTHAYTVTRDEEYLEMAQRNAQFLLEHLYDAELQTLRRTYKDGKAKYDGYVEDYAYFAEALTALYEATGEERWLKRALELADTMIEKFWDDERTGFYFADEDTELIARRKEIMDNAMPAGNSVAVHVLLRLAVLDNRSSFREKAEEVLSRLAEPMRSQPTAFGYLLQAALMRVGPLREVALVGPEREPFLQVLADELLPAVVVAQASETGAAVSPLLRNREVIGEETTAYVCQNYTCQQPVTDPDDFRRQLVEG